MAAKVTAVYANGTCPSAAPVNANGPRKLAASTSRPSPRAAFCRVPETDGACSSGAPAIC